MSAREHPSPSSANGWRTAPRLRLHGWTLTEKEGNDCYLQFFKETRKFWQEVDQLLTLQANRGPVDEGVRSEICLCPRIRSQFAVGVARAVAVAENREWLAGLFVVVIQFSDIGEAKDVRASLWVAIDDKRVTRKKQ